MAAITKLEPKASSADNSADKLKSPRTEPCEVIPFPAKRRIHFLRDIGAESHRQFEAEKNGEAYFRAIIGRHKQRLKKLGITQRRIDADVRAIEGHFYTSAEAAIKLADNAAVEV